MANYVVIPAAGTGSRMGAALPKQYLSLLGQPLIAHALQTFVQSALIDAVYVVLSPDDAHWDKAMSGVELPAKVKCLYSGGETRAQTVLNGLQAMADVVQADDWVLVHDAARPGLSDRLLTELIDALSTDAVGGLLALPLTDTLKKMDAAASVPTVKTTMPRQGLWQAQTPQMFRYALLKQALQLPQETPTDEAQAIEALGYAPKLVTGALRNLKVTYPQDLAVVRALLQAEETE